jgi:hypothetical protein
MRILVGTLLLSLVAGCGPEATTEPTAIVRDSAGLTIVENQEGSLEAGGGWNLATSPRTVIGGRNEADDTGLYRVRGAVRLPDGRIAVGNDGSREIKIYGADGTHVASLGKEGEGPGEFSSVILAGLLGDSLVVVDRRLRRVSLLHPDVGFIRSFTIAEPVAILPTGGWFFHSGSVLIQDFPLSDEGAVEDGFSRPRARLKSCDMSGALLSDFGELPGEEMFIASHQTGDDVASEILSVPFGKSPQIAVAGDRLFFGSQDRYEISVFDSRGPLQRIVRVGRSPIRVTDAGVGLIVDAELTGYYENEVQGLRREFDRMPRMEFEPAHGAITADSEGYLFVEDFRAPGVSTIRVNVFDPEGFLAGRFEVPADIEILGIGPDYLLALYKDPMDMEHVQLYELTRPG